MIHNTYTVRALTATDAAIVERVGKNHDTYRELVKSGTPVPYAHWAGLLEVNVEELLEVIERITRP